MYENIFEVVLQDKYVQADSSNLITTIQTNKIICLFTCNVNSLCNIAVVTSTNMCYLYKKEALNEIVDSVGVSNIIIYQNQK